MEAATLDRGGPVSFAQSLREAARPRSRAFWIVAGLTLLGAVLRFATLGVQAYHHDEIVTASRILRGGFGHAMDAVGFSESAPPLYYALLHVWMGVFGDGNQAVRLLSALFGAATLPLLYRAGRRLGGPTVGVGALVLLATSPFAIRYGTEARMYSLVALLVAAGWLLLANALERPRMPWLAGIAAVTGALLLTHYWSFYLVACTVAVLIGAALRGRLDRGVVARVIAAVESFDSQE